ncbi:BON domain-containing protein [Curtobacterium sp. KT1]|uniref:BON domain-containing protein n=1 Tax=Curtobacterium sp. KT1 TaxID=3372858 RepID=UPI0037C0657E
MDTRAPHHEAPSTVRGRLLQAWSAERSLDASTLDATVRDGRVVLTGDVGCHSDRVTAVGLAEQAAPGLAVENRIVVRGYDCDPDETDAAVTARVTNAITLAVPTAAVAPRVLDHVVTLSGAVGSDADRRSLHAAAARCPGVHFVVDLLVVT